MKKILIVDDDGINRSILKRIFNKTAYEIKEAVNGKDGL